MRIRADLWLLAAVLLCAWPRATIAQDATLVTHLLDLGQPRLAAVELARIGALSPAEPPPAEIRVSVARALWEAGAQREGIDLLTALVDGELVADPALIWQVGLWQLSIGELTPARISLERAAAFSQDPALVVAARDALCRLDVLRGDVPAVRACLADGRLGNPTADELARAERLLAEMEQRRRWRPVGAVALSVPLPGVPQLIHRDIAGGASTLALNLAWAAGAAVLARRGLYLEAAVVAAAWGGRIYVTTLTAAYRDAAARDAHRRAEAALGLYDLLAPASAAPHPAPTPPAL